MDYFHFIIPFNFSLASSFSFSLALINSLDYYNARSLTPLGLLPGSPLARVNKRRGPRKVASFSPRHYGTITRARRVHDEQCRRSRRVVKILPRTRGYSRKYSCINFQRARFNFFMTILSLEKGIKKRKKKRKRNRRPFSRNENYTALNPQKKS